MPLHNRIDKRVLKDMIEKDPTQRRTLSFYRYVQIDDPHTYRDELYRAWESMGCLGRIYLAKEGINAQMNVPIDQWNIFIEHLSADEKLNNIPLKIAVEDDNKSFYKLKIKVRKKIVADGLDDNTFNPWDTGRSASPK